MSNPRVEDAPRWERRFRGGSAVLAGMVIVIGVLTLVGWAFDVTVLKHVHPSLVAMTSNSAVLFVVLGIGVWLARSYGIRSVRARRVVGISIAVIAGAILAEYVFGIDLGIHELARHGPRSVSDPRKMAPASALTFALLGLALVLEDGRRTSGLSRAAALLAAMSALIALFGYAFGAPSLYAIGLYTTVSLHSALAFLLASCALLMARPAHGLAGLMTSDSEAGQLMRRLLPAILVVPLVLGWFRLRGQVAGYYDTRFGLALMTLTTTVSLAFFCSVIAASLRRSEVRRGEIEAADIIERARADQRLRESEQRFRALVDASAQVVWATDATGTLAEDSPSWRNFTGQSVDQMQGHAWLDVLHPDDRDRVGREWHEALRLKAVFVNEFRVRHVTGQWRWFAVHGVPLFDTTGKVHGWVGMNTDITARKHAEAGRERQLRETIEHAPHSVAVFDRNMNYVEASPGWLRDYGLGPDAIGKNHYELFPEISDRWKEVHRRCLAGATESNEGEPFVRKDGTVQWVRWKVCPWRDLEGVIGGIVIYGEDITAKRQADEQREQMLRDIRDLTRNLESRVAERTKEVEIARDRLDGIISMAADAIITIDDDQRITIFNRVAEQIFGWTRDEVLGKPLDILLPENVRSTHLQHVEHFAEEASRARPMADRSAITGLRKNGETFPAEATISKLRTRTGFQFTVILRDITDRKRLEDEQARIYGERALLLREIHHRVKNNLQVISSLFYLQAQRTEQESVRRLLDESRGRLQSIAIIHEKLYRSQQLALIDFDDYLRDLTASLMSAVGVQAPQVKVHVDANNVFMDIERAIPCALIVNELVSNSLKHAFPDGRHGEIRIVVRALGPGLRLEVSDNGIGFPPDLDFRSVTTLGLQLVVSLTKQLHGTVELGQGEGTTFRIDFPYSPVAQRAPAAVHAS